MKEYARNAASAWNRHARRAASARNRHARRAASAQNIDARKAASAQDTNARKAASAQDTNARKAASAQNTNARKAASAQNTNARKAASAQDRTRCNLSLRMDGRDEPAILPRATEWAEEQDVQTVPRWAERTWSTAKYNKREMAAAVKAKSQTCVERDIEQQ
ncbi:hypothetical protein C8F01DRAFT_1262916 [Mycena amicta]|nr:hypothetical protein C8F01DRAFT_1262916 [Mycena amicta]